MLVPHVKAMSQAIENHAAEHKNKEKDQQKAQTEAERIEDLLIKQVFEKIGQENKKHP